MKWDCTMCHPLLGNFYVCGELSLCISFFGSTNRKVQLKFHYSSFRHFYQGCRCQRRSRAFITVAPLMHDMKFPNLITTVDVNPSMVPYFPLKYSSDVSCSRSHILLHYSSSVFNLDRNCTNLLRWHWKRNSA